MSCSKNYLELICKLVNNPIEKITNLIFVFPEDHQRLKNIIENAGDNTIINLMPGNFECDTIILGNKRNFSIIGSGNSTVLTFKLTEDKCLGFELKNNLKNLIISNFKITQHLDNINKMGFFRAISTSVGVPDENTNINDITISKMIIEDVAVGIHIIVKNHSCPN